MLVVKTSSSIELCRAITTVGSRRAGTKSIFSQKNISTNSKQPQICRYLRDRERLKFWVKTVGDLNGAA